MRAKPLLADLCSEVAIVTGASRGLGLLARELARQHCPLVICARDQAERDQTAASLRDGAGVTAIACDITRSAAPQRLVDTALDRYGRLDIVISCAGLIQVGPADAGPADHDDAWQTMAFAPIRLALAALRERGHGRIVTIAPVGGASGSRRASGWALDNLGRGLHAKPFQQVSLVPGPAEEGVQPGLVKAVVQVGQLPQRPPSRRLALGTQPQHLQLFQAAQRGAVQQLAVQLQPGGFLPEPGQAGLIAPDWHVQCGHDVEQGLPVGADLPGQAPERGRVAGLLAAARDPVSQFGAGGSPGQMVVEIDAQQPVPGPRLSRLGQRLARLLPRGTPQSLWLFQDHRISPRPLDSSW